ncbi:recombinase [Paenibacillus sp. KS1]|uniref:recombinase family protein n=1 Tax=Paenibacillus sp. KS1 TaxID=1849249 RepID=UPI0008065D74|nr:recombinase family protein [Paenibacillus sp. KS1]OBY76745.1 recombinase [Paenibacillus sp. KS1]
MRVAIYARVSTKKDAQKNSLENQISYASTLAAQNGWTISSQYIDDGISGATRDKREAIQRLLEDSKRKKFDIVIAKSVSRLGRNTVENLQTAHAIESMDIRLILPEDNYDTETSTSKLMFNLKAVLAEEESAKLSERIKIGLRASAREGVYKASLPAFGYKRDNKKLVLDENYAPIVREIFDLYLYQDWGMYKISNYFISKGIATPRTVSGGGNAGTLWNQSSISVILKNIIYTGTLALHREETRDFISKKRKQVQRTEQIVHENVHPAIITMDEHIAVLEKMKKKGRNNSNGNESLFAHIAVCADCGKGMTFRKDRRKDSGGAYVCVGYVKHSASFCSSHIIGYNNLMQAIKDDLKELIADNVKLEKLYGAANSKANEQQSKNTKELASVTKRLNQLNKEFQTLLQLYSDKDIGIVQFKAQNEHIQEEQYRLTTRKAELELLLEEKKDTEEQLRAFQKQITRFSKLDIDNQEVMKQVLQRLIQKIEVNEDGSIKVIHYNISRPQSVRTLEQKGA